MDASKNPENLLLSIDHGSRLLSLDFDCPLFLQGGAASSDDVLAGRGGGGGEARKTGEAPDYVGLALGKGKRNKEVWTTAQRLSEQASTTGQYRPVLGQ